MKDIEQFFIETLMWKFCNVDRKPYQIIEVEKITVNADDEIIVKVKLKPSKGKIIQKTLLLDDFMFSQYSK